MSARAATVTALGVAFVVLGGCHAMSPSNRPVEGCIASCKAHLKRECSEDECARECEFILDRLVEKETENVIACVGRTSRRCTDVVWADCAARVGPHADGGPPPPPPPSIDD